MSRAPMEAKASMPLQRADMLLPCSKWLIGVRR